MNHLSFYQVGRQLSRMKLLDFLSLKKNLSSKSNCDVIHTQAMQMLTGILSNHFLRAFPIQTMADICQMYASKCIHLFLCLSLSVKLQTSPLDQLRILISSNMIIFFILFKNPFIIISSFHVAQACGFHMETNFRPRGNHVISKVISSKRNSV